MSAPSSDDDIPVPRDPESETRAEKLHAAHVELAARLRFVSQREHAQKLLAAGKIADATDILQCYLDGLDGEPSFERAVILVELGRCHRTSGRHDLTEGHARHAMVILEQLDRTEGNKRIRAVCLAELAQALKDQGM